MTPQPANRLELIARASQIEPLRHTPAGLPIARAWLEHQGQVNEAGVPRQVCFGVQAVALGALAQQLAETTDGTLLQVSGFLAPLRQGSDRLVLHIQQFAETL